MKRTLLTFAFTLSAVAAPIPLQKWDMNHSTISFRVPILGGMSEVEGKFTDFAVDVVFDEEHLENSRVKAVIHAASVDTGIADRDKHLRTADFFAVDKYPDINNTIIAGFAAQTPLNRQDYGVSWKHSVDPAFVGDDVQIQIRLITKKNPLPQPPA